MVSIIKNQLLKHLSRFTKNLSADKINLSTFKGEGELTNLELNENVLTDLLELPSWLKLTKAWSNKVSFRIQWTKLKSVPIHLNLDEVNITIETCDDLRPMSPQAGLSSYAAAPGKYSFIHKVIDGITVAVNTVNIVFNSPAFTASVQVSRILVESKDPYWRRADLRISRLKEPDKGQLLIFKEVEWQTVRIEAKSTKDRNLTPLRLITNQARCRITIKKRLSDCFIIGSRMVVIFDDLLWVLTDSQLKAALHFLDSLTGLVQKATLLTRKAKAARKLEELPEYQAQLAQQARVLIGHSNAAKLFSKFDVMETSYHFLSQHIVLHLCDDPGIGRSCHPHFKDGGALQISISKFKVDYYPYHLAKVDRKHWPGYRDTSIPHVRWLDQALTMFRTKVIDLVDCNKIQHTPLSRSSKSPPFNKQSNESPTAERYCKADQIRRYLLSELTKLMTSCMIIRIDDFTLYKVTTSSKKQELKVFISGDKGRISLPENSSNLLHAEFIYFYYPSDKPFPLPPPKFYVHVNPLQIYFDVDTCLWINSFALNLYQSLLTSKQDISGSEIAYIDVKIEVILPKIIFESSAEYPNQRDRPKMLNINVTRATITNVRSLEQSSRADLARCVDSFHMGSLFFGTDFPSKSGDFYIVTQKFLDHISATDNIRNLPTDLDISSEAALSQHLSRELFWTDAKDVWSINLEPVWIDFVGAKAVGGNKPIPFLDTVPISLWLHSNMDPNSTIKTSQNGPRNADIHILTYISNLVSIQINHYQYLFLLRLSEEVSEMATFLSLDSNRIMKMEIMGSLVVGAIIPQLEITFVMPSQYPGKESSGGDIESFVPDSSSIPDDMLIGGSSMTVFQSRELAYMETSDIKIDKVPNGIGTPYVGERPELQCEQEIIPMTERYNDSLPSCSKYMQMDQGIKLPNNFNVGFSSMKKGFKSMVTSIDSAFKPSFDDISETLSIKSDLSSDSENVELINDAERIEPVDAMFNIPDHEDNKAVEVASEVEEDTTTTISDHSYTSSCKRRDLVSVSTFKLNKVEFLQQSDGFSSNIKVQIGNITNEDCTSIPWDEFQTKFSSRTKAWSDSNMDRSANSKVKLRLDHTLKLEDPIAIAQLDFSDKDIQRKLFKDFLDVHVIDLNLTLFMSTIIGLSDLVEDEIIQIPLPMQVMLRNIVLHLNEDRPPANITSPGSIPIDLKISQIFIRREEDGIFRIELSKIPVTDNGNSPKNEEIIALKSIIQELRTENEELKHRLVAFDRVSKENILLHQMKEESDSLRSCLMSLQDKVSQLLEEKKKLLEDIEELRMKTSSDKNSHWNSKR